MRRELLKANHMNYNSSLIINANKSAFSIPSGVRLIPAGFRKVMMIAVWLVVSAIAPGLYAQTYGPHKQFAVIDFEDYTANDTMGNVDTDLLNGVLISEDADRGGKVARFNGTTGASLKLPGVPVRDSMTLSFWFKRQAADPADPWRMIFALFAPDGSDVYLTPRTSWNDKAHLISDDKPFSIYTGIPCAPVANSVWSHYAVVFSGNHVQVYQDGVLTGERTLLRRLSEMQFNQWYFINNPVKDYPQSGRLDDLVIYHSSLMHNQVMALYEELPVPAPAAYDPSEIAAEVTFTADYNDRQQTIRHFGSSDGWNTQAVGLYFTGAQKQELATLLFSTEMKPDGSPEGIGLSAWRFNIGAGTFEQGEESRIADPSRRTEGFLQDDGTYDWSKQAGQRWFLEQAALTYGVEDIIGWQNSPPVQFTVRGLGFREYGDPMETILAADKVDAFGDFLSEVALHFKGAGIAFDYISPLNEPQYGWAPDAPGGLVSQEGTPWTNRNIADVTHAIDQSFSSHAVEARLILTEAGSYSALTGGTGTAHNQLYELFNPASSLYIGDLPAVSDAVCAHSYWTDHSAEELVNTRKALRSTLKGGYPELELFQSEYSLLGSGYTFGHPTGDLSPMQGAVSLARVIHADLVHAGVTGWSWWSTFGLEKFHKNFDTDRFALLRFALNSDTTEAVSRTSKLLYTLGNYSRFIRPGMQRISVQRSDQLSDIGSVAGVMVSAWVDADEGVVVYVAVNASRKPQQLRLEMENIPGEQVVSSWTPYVTSGFPGDELKKYASFGAGEAFIVPPLSIVTFTGEAADDPGTAIQPAVPALFRLYPNPSTGLVYLTFSEALSVGSALSVSSARSVRLTDVSGKLLHQFILPRGVREYTLDMGYFGPGIYLVTVMDEDFRQVERVMLTD